MPQPFVKGLGDPLFGRGVAEIAEFRGEFRDVLVAETGFGLVDGAAEAGVGLQIVLRQDVRLPGEGAIIRSLLDTECHAGPTEAPGRQGPGGLPYGEPPGGGVISSPGLRSGGAAPSRASGGRR